MNFTITTKTTKKNLALVNVDQRCPVPKCEATITDRVPHLVRNSTVGNLLNDPYCTSVEDKNSTEAIRMWGLFFSSLPRSLGSTCVNNSYNWAAHKVGREAGHREVFQQIRSQLSDLPRFQAVPRCRACRIPPWTAGRWLSREQPTSKWSLHTGSNREWFFKSWEVSTLSVYQAAWVRQRPSSAKICRIP